jgi:CheY-like chemotaxis protein
MARTISAPKGAGYKILIVEDNQSFRQFFKENLESRFPSVKIFEAAEGKAALEIVETESPHLIFMDIQLPGENGLELTKKIKQSHSDIVVVVVTTYDFPEYREAALRYGANHFIPKDSLDWKEIENVVESLT